MRRDCPVCDRLVSDAVLCKFCTGTVHDCLARIPDLLAELEVTATRQARITARSGGRSAETPLPYGQRASDAIRQIHGVLRLWAGVLNPDRPFTALEAVKYLRINVQHLARHEMAEKAYDHITNAQDHALKVIDRDPDLVPAGRCDAALEDGTSCHEVLYGDPDCATVRCRCGAERDMDRTWMLEAARDREWTAAEIGRVTPGVTAAMVRGYARRGHLTPVGDVQLGPNRTAPTYRVGDLLDLLTRQTKEAS